MYRIPHKIFANKVLSQAHLIQFMKESVQGIVLSLNVAFCVEFGGST